MVKKKEKTSTGKNSSNPSRYLKCTKKKRNMPRLHFFLSMRKRQIVRDAIDHECNTLTVKASMVKKINLNILPVARIMNSSNPSPSRYFSAQKKRRNTIAFHFFFEGEKTLNWES